MNILKRFGFLLVISSTYLLNGQTDCQVDYTIYRTDYKNKNYDDALIKWRKVFANCPEYNKNIFLNGVRLFQDKIKQDKDNKSLYLDTLMTIYDKRIDHFGERPYVLGMKGCDLLRYDPSRYDDAYNMLKISFDSLGNSSLPNPLVYYFKSILKYEKNSELIGKQDILDAYIQISDVIAYNIDSDSKYASQYEKALNKIENMFSPYASCEDLVNIFDIRLEGDPSIDDLKKMISLLSESECLESSTFFMATSKLHKLEPSSFSSYQMGNMSLDKNDYNAAIKFFKQAIDLESDNKVKSTYYLKLAYAFQMKGSYSEARSSASLSSEMNPDSGDPYMLIGDLYVSSVNNCGESSLQKGAVYCLAIDMFLKAKRIDNVLSQKANKRISTYSRYFPSKEECFFSDIEPGSSYRIDCWIGRSTILRTRD